MKSWLVAVILVAAALSQACDIPGWTLPDGNLNGQLSPPTNTTTPEGMPTPPSATG